MPLQSKLLSGDPRLEACLVSDPAHITLGSSGDHVAKIQLALNRLIDAELKFDGRYGPATARSVMDYKNDASRRILQSFQTTADNIVGKRTIASLDGEMLAKERETSNLRIVVRNPNPSPRAGDLPVRRSALTLGFALPATFANIIINPTGIPTQSVRLKPRELSQLLIQNPGGDTVVTCVNNPPPSGGVKEKVSLLWDPDLPATDRLIPDPIGFGRKEVSGEVEGGRFFLFRKSDVPLNLDGYRPDDAIVTAVNSAGQTSTLQVVVRAVSAGPVPGAPLTKLEPGSKFFSARTDGGGEFDPHNLGEGRPVNPNRGGRLINLGGEQETPEFEDYQVTLSFSGYARPFFNGGKPVFRPMFNDTDSAVRVPPKKASHICMRGNPLTDDFIKAIKVIADAGCLFTFSGASEHVNRAKTLGGTVLEEDIPKGHIVIRL